MTKNTAGRGLEAHTAILYALVSRGEEVLIPWADHLRYDLAFVRYEGGFLSAKEPRLYRVQCKKARLTDDGSCIIFNAFNTIAGESGRRAGVKGYRGEIEYFGVFSPDTGKCYLVPVDAVPVGVQGYELRSLAIIRKRVFVGQRNLSYSASICADAYDIICLPGAVAQWIEHWLLVYTKLPASLLYKPI